MVQHRREKIRVLCVDDNELIGEAMSIELALTDDLKWVGQLLDADRLLKEVERRRPDVILLDIDMPGEDPFVALRHLCGEYPWIKVLMLTGHVRSDLIDRAIEAGAWGYISKSERVPTILNAVRRAANGEFVMSPQASLHHWR